MRIEIVDPMGIIQTNMGATVVRDIHAGTESLMHTLDTRVTSRTSMLTGALRADETGDFFTDPATDDLVHLYTKTENQMEVWRRVYVEYQEGPPLGLSTYTNPPRLMYESATTMDIPLVEQWGTNRLNEAAENITQGNGVMK